MRGRSFSRLAGIVIALVANTSAWSAVLRVPSEYATINDGLDAAASGDTVLVAAGTYSDFDVRVDPLGNLMSSIAFLRDGVVLRSEEGSGATTIDMTAAAPGSFARAVLGSQLSEDVWVEGFTVTSDLIGVVGASISRAVVETVTATFEDCVFRDLGHGNSSEGALAGSSPLRVLDCQFRDISGGTGSAIHASRSVEVVGSLFENCSSGAVALDEGNNPASDLSATFTNSVFRDNFQDMGGGGAIYVRLYDFVEVIDCVFEGNVSTGSAGAIALSTLGATVEIGGTVFSDNHANGGGSGGACRLNALTLLVQGNTFHGCTQEIPNAGGSAIRVEGETTFENNIISSCAGASAVSLIDGTIASSCNVYWENTDGDTQGFVLGPTDLVADPRFCAPNVGDLRLQKDSPCLPPNSGGCGLIGALGMGCGTVALEDVSWGELKALYRE